MMSKDDLTAPEMLFACQVKRNGPILNSSEIACKFGELVLRREKLLEVVQQQLPLKAIDQGDTWLISGAPEITADKPGPWQMTVNKSDCRIKFINDYSARDPSKFVSD